MARPDIVYVHTLYDPPVDPGIENTEESMTQQHFAQECDINYILDNYMKTGVLIEKNTFFGDFSDPVSLQSAITAVQEAHDAFYELPSSLRERFSNNPMELLEFLSISDNRAEAISLGLISPPPAGGDVSTSTTEGGTAATAAAS